MDNINNEGLSNIRKCNEIYKYFEVLFIGYRIDTTSHKFQFTLHSIAFQVTLTSSHSNAAIGSINDLTK